MTACGCKLHRPIVRKVALPDPVSVEGCRQSGPGLESRAADRGAEAGENQPAASTLAPLWLFGTAVRARPPYSEEQ